MTLAGLGKTDEVEFESTMISASGGKSSRIGTVFPPEISHLSARLPSLHDSMRAHSILLGLVSAALALPPRPGEGGQTFAIVQQFQTEQPRLASRLARRHEHHHDEALVDATAEEAWREKYEHDGGGDAATEGVLDAGFSATTSAAVSAPSSHPAMNSHHEEEGEHDHHHSREPPKLVLDEEEILKTHAPDPPSYLDLDRTSEGMPGTMVAHVVLMCLAFFGLLPLGKSRVSFLDDCGRSSKQFQKFTLSLRRQLSRHLLAAIFLKAGGSHLAILPQVGFLALSLFGFFLGIVYARNTPDRYEGSSHTSWGWFTMALAVILNVVDVVRFLVKFTRFEQRFESMISLASSKVGWSRAEKHVTELHSGLEERTALVDSPSYEYSPGRCSLDQPQILSPSSSRGNSLTFSDSDTVYDSAGPDLGGVNVAAFEPPRSRLQIFVSNGLALAMRLLIVIAYIDVFNGVSVYTGVCRGNYLNGCIPSRQPFVSLVLAGADPARCSPGASLTESKGRSSSGTACSHSRATAGACRSSGGRGTSDLRGAAARQSLSRASSSSCMGAQTRGWSAWARRARTRSRTFSTFRSQSCESTTTPELRRNTYGDGIGFGPLDPSACSSRVGPYEHGSPRLQAERLPSIRLESVRRHRQISRSIHSRRS